MDTKRLGIGTVVAGIVIAVVGFPIYEVLLEGFFDAQFLVTPRVTPVWWSFVAGLLAHGLLLTLVVGWAGESSAAGGFKVGALVGFLVWFGTDATLNSVYEYATMTGVLADSAISVVQYGLGGAAVAVVTGKRGGSSVAA